MPLQPLWIGLRIKERLISGLVRFTFRLHFTVQYHLDGLLNRRVGGWQNGRRRLNRGGGEAGCGRRGEELTGRQEDNQQVIDKNFF